MLETSLSLWCGERGKNWILVFAEIKHSSVQEMPRYLRARVAAQRPTKRPVGVLLKKGVLLLNPKPEFGQIYLLYIRKTIDWTRHLYTRNQFIFLQD